MAKLERRIVAKGEFCVVECAVLADGTSPAWDFLDALRRGHWEPDPDAEDLPDEEQIRDREKFYEMAQRLAKDGQPAGGSNGNQTNYLTEGIWEFKVGKKRLTFWDTNGRGQWDPKPKILDVTDSPYPDEHTWWFPELDRIVRLGHAFPKAAEKTEKFDLAEAIRVREEDVAHDRNE